MSQNIQSVRIQSRVDTKENWAFNNPILLENEIGYESDTGNYKIGKTDIHWNDLPYAITNSENGNKDGVKGYYFTDIDFTENKILLSKSQTYNGEIFTIDYEVGDIISISNNAKYYNCA